MENNIETDLGDMLRWFEQIELAKGDNKRLYLKEDIVPPSSCYMLIEWKYLNNTDTVCCLALIHKHHYKQFQTIHYKCRSVAVYEQQMDVSSTNITSKTFARQPCFGFLNTCINGEFWVINDILQLQRLYNVECDMPRMVSIY